MDIFHVEGSIDDPEGIKVTMNFDYVLCILEVLKAEYEEKYLRSGGRKKYLDISIALQWAADAVEEVMDNYEGGVNIKDD